MHGDRAPLDDTSVDTAVGALNCNDLDIEVMQFLIDSFICLFPAANPCYEYGQECCYDSESQVDCNDSHAANHCSRKQQYTLHDQDGEDDENDGIVERDNDAFGWNFCHPMGP
jgi:hypothetical protein